MVRFLELTYVGTCLVADAEFRLWYRDEWNACRLAQPELFDALNRGMGDLHGLPTEMLFNEFPTHAELLQTFVHVPSSWTKARTQCVDLFRGVEIPAISSKERHDGRETVAVRILPFTGDPLSSKEVWEWCRRLRLKPLTAMDALAYATVFLRAPRPFCAVGSVFTLEGERYVLSIEDDEHGLPTVEFRKEGYLPRRAFIPVYAF